ncbi:MAG TPA: phenylalanine--tRNA ligase subunit beta [Acetobacteraceae bacterium]|nr:phenylalanine--tRNA ligase subunit beta [Acetobacteraceae bacterium]
MKFTLAWLRTHLETAAPLERIAETLSAIGLEVESLTDRAAALAPFRIAEVLEAAPHPNADRLKACRVNTGEGIVSVVCGAPNAHAGMKAVFAPPGSHIPGTGITLKRSQIRGVESAGMLLSLREMALGEDHDGIIELPPDAPVGESYAHWAGLDDPLIEIAVTPNRGDALGVRGIARDLAAAGLGRLLPWDAPPVPAHFPSPLSWAIDWPEACPWVLGRTIRGLRNGPSPRWLEERLTAIGLRPINALVDITNFFTFDLGRPLHVFDAAKIVGSVLTLRRGGGEAFRALNGRDVVVSDQDCVIADGSGVVSLAGIVGGEASGCDEGTDSVFLECALFDPVRIAETGRRLGILSDARARFERGIDPALMPHAVEAASRMILDLCGGEASSVVAAGKEPRWQRSARLRFSRLAALGGLAVPAAEAVGILERLGFTPETQDEASVTVTVPPWRNDIAARIELALAPDLSSEEQAAMGEAVAAIEPEVELIEEVLRIEGLDSIPPVSLPARAPVPAAALAPPEARAQLARRVLAARGLAECVGFSFVSEREAALFGPAPETLRLENPIAADLDQMRPTPLVSLALAARRNAARGLSDTDLFEIGPAFLETVPDEQCLMAAGIRSGATRRSWIAPSRPVDALDAKADALALLASLGVPAEALTLVPPGTDQAAAHYHPGRSGLIGQGPKLPLGRFGELHPRLLAALDLPRPCVAFEIFLDQIPEPKRRARRAPPELSPFQPLSRDFAFIVEESMPADSVLRAARGAERSLITSVTLFDVFTGPAIGAGKKSLGIEVVFQPRERTLTDAEIEASCRKVVEAVAKATGAVLRG